MPFNIKAISKGEYVLVRHYGNVTVTELEEGRASAKNLLKEKGWRKVLFDTTGVLNDLSTLDIFNITKSHKHVFDRQEKIGLLLSSTPERMLNGTFIEDIAQNRGIRLKVFYNSKKAKVWLKDIDGSKTTDELIKFLAVIFESFLPAFVDGRT